MYKQEVIKLENSYYAGEYDIIVVGAGHAGCEAAVISAKMNFKTLLFTLSIDSLANLPCNPSIGGTAKGQLVREIDALGGIMGKMADDCAIQYRMLNASKGPAVRSPRAQIDRKMYQQKMLAYLEKLDNLSLKQAEIIELILDENHSACGVMTKLGAIYYAKKIIICSGTYLDAEIFIGQNHYSSGPDNIRPAIGLAASLEKHGLKLRRFKTGTPVRINKRSIDFSKFEQQDSDTETFTFSFTNENKDCYPLNKQLPCYMTYTTDLTKKIIQNNLHRSPLYSGDIEGVGPRYCPSIEDKIVRFSDKERHQIFIEPMGLESQEMYLQGLSSSLPEDVQIEICHSVPGLENADIQRPAYAIEYQCLDPQLLNLDLELRDIKNLYAAGQINGTSGYEEAAAQGLMAGINACLAIKGEDSFVLTRDEAYIGVLIDDLVNKGTAEPYRMMTSRAEYRLLLRHDNADERLRKYAFKYSLITEEEYQIYLLKMKDIEMEIKRLRDSKIKPSDPVCDKLRQKKLLDHLYSSLSLAELLSRPHVSYQDLQDLDLAPVDISPLIADAVQIKLKYQGYIDLELKRIEKFKKLENKKIPSNLDYKNIKGLSAEAVQKLSKYRPESLGQASRISGVSPADISVLLVSIHAMEK